jgi:hypothetical protein
MWPGSSLTCLARPRGLATAISAGGEWSRHVGGMLGVLPHACLHFTFSIEHGA